MSTVPLAEPVAVEPPVVLAAPIAGLNVALASDWLFSDDGAGDLEQTSDVCLDLDQVIEDNQLPRALGWVSNAAARNKRVIVIGTSKSYSRAKNIGARGEFLWNRRALAPDFRTASREDLLRAVVDVLERRAANSQPAGALGPAAKPAVPAGRRAPEMQYTHEVMTPEQKAQFRAFMHRT
jgi:hypothetical protein